MYDRQRLADVPRGKTSKGDYAGNFYDLYLQSASGLFALSTETFDYVPPPTLTYVSPASGPEAGYQPVEIVGTNLNGVTAVDFGTIPGTIDADPKYRSQDSSTELWVVSPSGASVVGTTANPVDVYVTTPGGTTVPPITDQGDPGQYTTSRPPTSRA